MLQGGHGARWLPASVRGMDPEPLLLQTGPETFELHRPARPAQSLRLRHRTRRGLGLAGVAPHTVARELLVFLEERGATPAQDADLGAVAGRFPEFVDELRSRLG